MYQERVEKVLSAMEKMGLDQMLVSNPNSIWYLTGYYVFPYERMLALYLRRDGNHILFLNRLFPEPEADCRQIWFSDTDDCVAMVAEQVDGSKPLGIDKEWPAMFLLPLMDRLPGCRCVLALSLIHISEPTRP